MASDAEEARALLLRDPASCDAALIDQEIGRTEAIALAAEARRAGVADCLIMLSPLERRQFGSPREAGFTGFLVKPVRARSLYQRLSPRPVLSAVAAEPAASPPPPSRPRLSVLVAEDNEINALLATRTLERFGCAAVWAPDGSPGRWPRSRRGSPRRGPCSSSISARHPHAGHGRPRRRPRGAGERRRKPGRAPLPLVAVSANVADGTALRRSRRAWMIVWLSLWSAPRCSAGWTASLRRIRSAAPPSATSPLRRSSVANPSDGGRISGPLPERAARGTRRPWHPTSKDASESRLAMPWRWASWRPAWRPCAASVAKRYAVSAFSRLSRTLSPDARPQRLARSQARARPQRGLAGAAPALPGVLPGDVGQARRGLADVPARCRPF